MRFLAALSQNPADHFLMLKKPTPPPAAGVADGMAGADGMAAGMSPNGIPTGGYNPNAVPGQPNSARLNNGQPGAGYNSGMASGGQMSEAQMYQEDYEEDEAGYGSRGSAGGRQPRAPGSLPPVRVSDSSMAAVASVLWNRNAVATVTSQLDAAASPASVADALALASTIPSDAVRHSTFALFEKSHAEGAAGMTGSGLFRDVARDPGLLAVLKALPRKRGRKPAASNINAPAPAPDPSESWVAATQDVMLSLRDRLRDVADNPNLAYDGLQRLRLHRGAIPERSIMIKAPDSGAEALGEAAPADTTMFYTQCRLSPQTQAEMRDMQDIADHYEKRSKGIKREDRQRGILWYDGVKVNANGTRETIDVVIEQVGFQPQRNAGGGGYEDGGGGGFSGAPGGAPQFTIEVIVVVTKDPKTPPAAAAVSTASIK